MPCRQPQAARARQAACAMQAARARQAAVPGSVRDPGPSRDRTFADDECVAFGVFELVLLKCAQSEVITAI